MLKKSSFMSYILKIYANVNRAKQQQKVLK